ncbi:MAG: NTP transferase domain-containing protein [Euryarchaeota archaeon]|nr:NTP transferase domain-containing protein [Euryarchaeota archaeon]
MIAIILAGGKSSRMGWHKGGEKAVTKIDGKRLIDLVVESVSKSKVSDFFVAISDNTPETAAYCKHVRYKTVATSGAGYHEDLQYLLSCYPEFISVACDIPFLRTEHINAMLEAFSSHRTSITGAVPRKIVPKKVIPSYTFEHEGKELVSCGINVVTSSKDTIPFLFNDPLLSINVNTRDDLRIADTILQKLKGS